MMQGLGKGMSLFVGLMMASANPVLAQDSAAADAFQSSSETDTQTEVDQPKVQPQTPEDTVIRRRPSTLFALGYGQVQQIGKNNYYDRLYGSESRITTIQAGYYVYTYGLDIGFSGRFGFYTDKGHPLTSLSNLETPVKGDLPDSAVVDPKQNLELTLIPVQALLELAYSPFPVSRRIVLRGWAGPEYLFVQEALKPNLPSGQSAPAGTSLVSKGWNMGMVTGAMLSFSLSGIESRSDYALKAIGVDRIYISPYVEIVKTTQDKMGNYDRNVYGINLSFEGLR